MGRSGRSYLRDSRGNAARTEVISSMSFPPEAFLIGGQRCGTTNLAHLLSQHPRITLSVPKEPAYFTIRWHLGAEWYRSRFSGAIDSVFLDATTWYSVAPTKRFPPPPGTESDPYGCVPERIHSVNPKAKFVYSLRDPVSRTYSAFLYYAQERNEKRPFLAAIMHDPFYLRGSDYLGQIKNYADFFSIDSFLFLKFEDMVQNPKAALDRVFRFLELEPIQGTIAPAPSQQNPAFPYNALGRGLATVLRGRDRVDALRRAAQGLGPRSLKPLVDKILRQPMPPLRTEDRSYIANLFRDDRPCLERLTGLDLGSWQS